MLHLAGTTGSDHRDGDIVPDVVDQFNIKAAIGTVLINAVEKNFPCTVLFTGLCKLQGINNSSFSTAFYGALIPTDFGT